MPNETRLLIGKKNPNLNFAGVVPKMHKVVLVSCYLKTFFKKNFRF